jgi:DNA-binding MarR family transcriptional regulator
MNQDLHQQTISCIAQVVTHLIWLGHKRFTQQLTNYGLTAPQYFTLFALTLQGEACPMSVLAQATHQDAATVTGIINRLIKLGYVSRRRGQDDRRKVYVTLQQAGHQVVEKVKQAKHKEWQRSLAVLDQDELDETLRILEIISHTWQATPSTDEEQTQNQLCDSVSNL